MGVPVSFLIMALYFLRLCIHDIPPREQIVSVFLPAGPCGQGAFGLLQLAIVLRTLVHRDGVSMFGGALSIEEEKTIASAVYGVSLFIALIMWGLGLFWLAIAVGTVVHMAKKGGFPFNMVGRFSARSSRRSTLTGFAHAQGWWGKRN
jgi:tellurite resistance protein TehA-like permease